MYEDKTTKWLKKSIKLHKKVIDAFQYRYFLSDEEDGDLVSDFNAFREDVLYRLIDEQKKMEMELFRRCGRL